MTDFLEFLKATSYPGRGILVGRRCVYYFIMGRSENSRNRVFVKTEDGIRTEAHDPAKLSDPSLIIYHPVRTMGRDLVVTNGAQTDTICEHGDFRRGLMTREYEPDGPNWTPRISAIMHEDGSFELSILKRKDGRCLREFFCYEGCDKGKGYFISTYQGDGDPLPTFAGEPMAASVPRIVATTMASKAIVTVTVSAFMMRVSCNSSVYQRKEKPSHFARLLPALKLCTISTIIGRYRKIRMSARYARLQNFFMRCRLLRRWGRPCAGWRAKSESAPS